MTILTDIWTTVQTSIVSTWTAFGWGWPVMIVSFFLIGMALAARS